ncbi:MAG: hypothetical protein ABIF40_01900 [archaeon]
MDIKIIKEKVMPLLARKRVTLIADYAGKSTPSIKNLIPQIAKLTKSEPKLVTIRHIYQKYGKTQAKIISHIYESEKMAKLLEAEKRLFKEEKPKEEEKPIQAEEKVTEEPAKAEGKPKKEVE